MGVGIGERRVITSPIYRTRSFKRLFVGVC